MISEIWIVLNRKSGNVREVFCLMSGNLVFPIPKFRLTIILAIVTFRGLALHRKKNSEKLFECTRKNDERQI